MPVFFNLFAAAEPYISVTSLMEPHAMIRESSGIYRRSVSFRVYGDRCPQQSHEAKNMWGLNAKRPKAKISRQNTCWIWPH